MLHLLLLITIVFMFLNLMIQDKDYMHPSFLFSLVFFVYTFVCVLSQKTYAITLHAPTVVVITLGLSAFTLVGAFSKRIRLLRKKQGVSRQSLAVSNTGLKKIYISNWLVVALIALQLVTIYYFIQYLHAMTAAYNVSWVAEVEGQVSLNSLTAQIDLYDTITKFWNFLYVQMNVPIPMLYRIGNPLTTAAAYILIYVAVNNFLVDYKINVLHLISIALLCVLILLNGSRSPLFRLVTMVLVLFYILTIKQGRHRKGDRKVLFRIGLVVLLAGAGFILMLNLMGRMDDTSAKISRYLFIYLGAPVVNLDTYLSTSVVGFNDGLLGAQTFKPLYAYLGKLFHIAAFSYKGIGQFEFSANGIEIGNVYTMFHKIVYDFGYGGVLPLTLIQAGYFVLSYDRIMEDRARDNAIYFRLFIYAYLFNDLVMSAFSARFYETALDAPFLKLLLLAWIYDLVLFRKKAYIGRFVIPLRNANYIGKHLRFKSSHLIKEN